MFSFHCSLGFCTSADLEDYCDTDAVDLRFNPLASQILEQYVQVCIYDIFVNIAKKRIFGWSYSANKIKIHTSTVWPKINYNAPGW